MNEADYILISDIHNYTVCPRRCALRALEGQYQENWRTVDGTNMHKRANDGSLCEKRCDKIIMRALKVSSRSLGITGTCDVVEFHRRDDGIELWGYAGKYIPFPIEYKRGLETQSDCDRLQLCAQAICLEEMLLCEVKAGALFYGKTHRRVEVEMSTGLREKVVQTGHKIHELIKAGKTPKPVKNDYCNQCSLLNECLPILQKKQLVDAYIKKHLKES